MGQIATCVGEDEAATASPCNPQKLDGLHLHPLCRSFREAFYHQEKGRGSRAKPAAAAHTEQQWLLDA